MKIICVVKFVPDVDNFSYDHERHVLIRENSRMMVNPDDACALGFALKLKKRNPDTEIELLTMAPESVTPLVENILRVDVDRATLISDRMYAGSDSYATAGILARYLSSAEYDCLLTGTHAIDGDTSHIPPQIAELLGLNQISGISRIDEESFDGSRAEVDVEDEFSVIGYEIQLPAVLSLTRESGYRLPYVRHKNLKMDVAHKLNCLTNEDLGFTGDEVGQKGSRTRVIRSYTKQYEVREKLVVGIDDNGIDTVFNFLKEKKFI
jgi:electron transfer flavoprotein beta subunit